MVWFATMYLCQLVPANELRSLNSAVIQEGSAVMNYGNSYYTVAVYVGSNKQPVELIVDLNQPQMWFAGESCEEKCGVNTVYQESESSTYIDRYDIKELREVTNIEYSYSG